MLQPAKLSIAAISVICLGLFGCSGDDNGSTGAGGAVSGDSGKVVSCDIKTSQAGYEAESCTEIPESSPIAETFKQNCSSQNTAGVSTAKVGTGCPAAQKKCSIGDQTVYYYGDAANFAQCSDDGNGSNATNNSGKSNNSGSSNNSGNSNGGDHLPTLSGTIVSLYYVRSDTGVESTYCLEYGTESSSARIIGAEKANCNELDEYESISCTIGTGCPYSKKVCGSEFTGGLKYFYDKSDISKSCANLM